MRKILLLGCITIALSLLLYGCQTPPETRPHEVEVREHPQLQPEQGTEQKPPKKEPAGTEKEGTK